MLFTDCLATPFLQLCAFRDCGCSFYGEQKRLPQILQKLPHKFDFAPDIMLKGSTLKALDVRILQHFIVSSCQQNWTRHYANANGIQRSYITFNDFRNKNRSYTKKELVGYSMQDMYNVVADVSNYYKFVPYVKKSHVHSTYSSGFKADLIVGFPPLNERYTSRVTLEPHSLVKSECHDGRLFSYLLNEWRFSPGLKDIPNSCVLDFRVDFEFKSLLHSNIANIFFDLICDQMEGAFIQEVGRRNGPPSIRSHVLRSKRS